VSARNAKSKAKPATGQVVVHANTAEPVETAFAEVVGLIEQARQRAYQAVDSELVGLYWRIGQYISAKLAAAVWGEGVVDRLAQHLARTIPGQRGFTRRNLFRMRQFYETAWIADERRVSCMSRERMDCLARKVSAFPRTVVDELPELAGIPVRGSGRKPTLAAESN